MLAILGAILIIAGGLTSVLTPPTTVAFPLAASGVVLILVWIFT